MVKGKNRLVLVILCISNFLCMLDTTIMTIVIPKIQSGLNASLDQVSWAVNLYAIIFASVTLLAARIAEIYGKNRYLLYGLILFLIGSIGSGCTPSLGFLYGSRIIQSLGASGICSSGWPGYWRIDFKILWMAWCIFHQCSILDRIDSFNSVLYEFET